MKFDRPYYADRIGMQDFMKPPEGRSTGESNQTYADRLVGWSFRYLMQLLTTYRDQLTTSGPIPDLDEDYRDNLVDRLAAEGGLSVDDMGAAWNRLSMEKPATVDGQTYAEYLLAKLREPH